MAKEDKKEEVRANNDSPQQTDPKPILRVTTLQQGFRRAGRAWEGVTTVLEGELSKHQIEQLKAEPKLVVEVL